MLVIYDNHKMKNKITNPIFKEVFLNLFVVKWYYAKNYLNFIFIIAL